MTLYLSGDPEADRLISEDPLALLIGMVLDQQIPFEKAFCGPLVLRERLGGELDAQTIAAMDPDDLIAVFAERPAIHRFPAAMARRVADLCRAILDRHDGDAAAIWEGVRSGDELLGRLEALPGFGKQKAQIFLAVLGKRLGVRPVGWREAAGAYGKVGTFVSIADVGSAAALAKVREHKRETKAALRAEASATG